MSTTSTAEQAASALSSASTGDCPVTPSPSSLAVGPPGRPVSKRCSPAHVTSIRASRFGRPAAAFTAPAVVSLLVPCVICSPLDRGADGVSPLRPASVIVADTVISQQVLEHEPGVRRPLADATVRHHVVIGTQRRFTLVQRSQLVGAAERAIRVGGTRP